MSQTTSNLLYLVTIICFILALRFLSSPKHARLGNRIGAAGMAIAIVVTALQTGVHVGWLMIVGGAIGGGVRSGRGAPREDDRDAADGGAVQRRRRRRGGARRARGVPQHRRRSRAGCTATSRSRSCSRC